MQKVLNISATSKNGKEIKSYSASLFIKYYVVTI